MKQDISVVFALGLCGLLGACAGVEPEDELVGKALEAQVADPIAFCNASGLNVIIGTPNDDAINGTPRSQGSCRLG